MNSIEDIGKFVSAGNAVFKITDYKKNYSYTYKVRRHPDFDYGNSNRVWFVSLLETAGNESDYVYIGLISRNEFRHTHKSYVSEEDNSFTLFDFVFTQILRKTELPEHIEFLHTGQCGRCGRQLTTPESIIMGLGPVCATR